MAKKPVKVTTMLTKDEAERLASLAQTRDVTQSWLLRQAWLAYLVSNGAAVPPAGEA